MTRFLQQAFGKALQLSPDEQDAVAGWLLEELESKTRWEKSFQSSQDLQASYALLRNSRLPGAAGKASG
jgi:hypothetical protein